MEIIRVEGFSTEGEGEGEGEGEVEGGFFLDLIAASLSARDKETGFSTIEGEGCEFQAEAIKLELAECVDWRAPSAFGWEASFLASNNSFHVAISGFLSFPLKGD